MAQQKQLDTLVINKVENQEVYNYLKNNNLINEDELYLIEGEEGQDITLTKETIIDALGYTPANNNSATISSSGLMSAEDKAKLDGIEESANNYVHPSNHPATMITTDATHRFVTDTEKSLWDAKSNFSGSYNDLTNKPTIPTATSQLTNDSGYLTSVPAEYVTETELNAKGYLTEHQDISGKVDKVSGKGLSTNDYTTDEKNKLASIAEGAQVNQNAFSNVVVGSTTVAADNATDTLTLVAGTNITIMPDVNTDKITISTNALDEAKAYADGIKNDLLNGAGEAYDTLKELGDLIDTNADAIDALETVASGKADKVHTHAISDVTNLQSALDGKANTSHGTHVSYSTTAPVMDGTASVGTASTVARSDHKHPTDTSRAAASDLTSHTGNTTVHITSAERNNWNNAKSHADSAHAPSNAQANVIESVKVDGTALTVSNKAVNIELSGKVDKVSGKGLSTNDLTNTLKSNYDAAYTHSQQAHAPSGAQANIIETIKVNGTAQTVTSKAVDITVPTKTSQLTNDSGFKTTDNNTTYSLSKNGSTITLTGSDGKTTSVTDSDTTYSTATQSANGLMSSEDKTKLDGIAIGANKTDVDSALSSTSTNPVQNKVINTALAGKSDTSHTHTKADIGLGNVTNDAQVKRSEMGAASGVATLGTDGKVPSSQLPSYVDDVLEYNGMNNFPATGESDKIYVDTSDNKTYRWSGSNYVEISASIVIGTTTGTALDGKIGTDHINNKSNPHGVTKSQVGLGNVENKSSATIRGELTKDNVITALGYTPPTQNTTYGVATSSTLGLVKSGTDITVDASGNVSVNDDSHNHIISNVDGLQTALDGKASTATATTSVAGLMSAADKSKLDGITDSADAVSFSRSLTSGTKVGTITINGVGTDLYAPTNTDTHYIAKNIMGSSATATSNVTAATSNPYLNLIEDGAVRSSHRISGSGATTVKTDTSGNITISSTNTTYSTATTSANGLMSSTDKAKLDGIAANANNYTHPTGSGYNHIPSGGAAGNVLKWSADGVAVWGASAYEMLPVGSVIIWTGDTLPAGWELYDTLVIE